MSKRRQWIINKNFQYRFILMSIMPAILLVLFFWLGVEYLFYKMILMSEELGIPKGHIFFSLLKSQKSLFNIIMLVIGFGTIVLFGLWSVSYSNKIAGPLNRLADFLKNLKRDTKGEFPKLVFRDGDYFVEVSDELNSFLARESFDIKNRSSSP